VFSDTSGICRLRVETSAAAPASAAPAAAIAAAPSAAATASARKELRVGRALLVAEPAGRLVLQGRTRTISSWLNLGIIEVKRSRKDVEA
jgi:hypothetical protein